MDEIIRNTVNRIFTQATRSDSPGSAAGQRQKQMPCPDINAIKAMLDGAICKTHAYYFEQQYGDGYWWYELESNVTITAEYLMLLHFLGLNTREKDRKIANYILNKQRPDGTWAIHYGARGDLNTTVEAYFALKLAGHSADSLPCARRGILYSKMAELKARGYLHGYSSLFLASSAGGPFRPSRLS